MNGRACLLVAMLSATACRGPKTAADSGSPGLEEQRRAFLDGCAKKTTNAPEYCECAWDEFAKLFTEEEMKATEVPPGKLQQYQKALTATCSNKLPEETVKAGYDKGCLAGRPEFGAYCDCTYKELRATFQPSDLADSETIKSRRFDEAKSAAVKACAAHVPEATVRESFLKGCTKDPSLTKFCNCAWSELRKQVTPAELESGEYDEKTVFPQVEKACGKHRPK